MKKFTFAFLFLLTAFFAKATPPDNQEQYQISITKTDNKIDIDGKLDEEAWKNSSVATGFWQKWPTDTAMAGNQTEVRMFYDDNFLYISAICYDGGKRVIQTLKRDVGHWESDGFAIVLDPVNERSNGFVFGVNAGGAQMEGLVSANGTSEEWDAKWYSQITQHEDYWIVEMAIPFKSIRYDQNLKWGVNFVRNDMGENLYSTWAKVPIQISGTDLGFTGLLSWDNPPPITKGNTVLIPYIFGGTSQNFEDSEEQKYTYNAGLDAKIAITSNLNVDVTINPDFSQVDVDQQVTNLSRFSLFFPERRNFFLENSDIFSEFGTGGVRPFFSRRIGLRDGEQVPIQYGVRLSGNITKSFRIGVMDVQTDRAGDFPAQNYFVAALQQRVLKRSRVKAFIVNRQSTSTVEGSDVADFNRVAGLEFQYFSADGKWRGAMRYHNSMNPQDFKNNDYWGGFAAYESRNFWVGFASERVGENYITDVGFVPRLYNYNAETEETIRIGYLRLNGWTGYNFRPENSQKLNVHGPRAWSASFLNPDQSLAERFTGFGYNINFKNTSFIWISAENNEVNLPFPTSIVGDEPLDVGNYNFTNFNAEYGTDSRKAVWFSFFADYGGFYNGTRLGYGGSINLRQQPWGNFSIEYNRNEIKMPEELGNTELDLVRTTVEISFSNTMFWTTFLQYNTQADDFNVNSRFQWRFKPMSDLFIVYTDNYIANNFKVKNRAFVVKLNYWLNI